MLNTNICEEEDRVVMYFDGRLDTADAAPTEKKMKVLHECKNQHIVLDLTSLDYICSAGLRLFLTLLQKSRANGSTISLVGLSPYVRSVFDETGFSRLFKLG